MKRFLATAAFLVSIQTSSLMVSCVSGPVTDGGGSGGATGGTGGGAPVTGGTNGDGDGCDGTLGEGGECGVCQVSVEQYCADGDCTMPNWEEVCVPENSGARVYAYCGYKHLDNFVRTGTGPDGAQYTIYTDIWDEESGQLVYHATQRNYGCAVELRAGERPECDELQQPFCSGGPMGCESVECFSDCLNGQCLPAAYDSCPEYAAAVCGYGGQGGQGGFGGAAP